MEVEVGPPEFKEGVAIEVGSGGTFFGSAWSFFEGVAPLEGAERLF